MSKSTTKPLSKTGPKERRFLDALRDLFVGAKVDGESGYINLMRIKASYFTGLVEPALMEDIADALTEFPEFREEMFDKLHAFFSRYFSRSGSICFAYTPNHFSVYEKVYTDEQDVVLFWKTHMLYYVKTDRLFRDLKVEMDGETFFFDCTKLEHKKANEKRQLVHTFEKVEKDDTIRLVVTYSQSGRKTKTDDILKALKKAGRPVKEATLEKAIKVFGRQSEVDYFINKDARGFLREQFDLWMYQYMFRDETHWTAGRVQELQALKAIAFKIIDFIAQFEDELVRVWNKPKFVRDSHYVVTLDRLAAREGGLDVIAALVKHKGMKEQVAEWIDLGMVKKGFDAKGILKGTGKKQELVKDWQFLPVDTKYFADVELRLIGLFDDLDEELDGRLIKSENYQALNTLREKYRERVKCCYIDPPYNTGQDEFPYNDDYKSASWLTFVRDRIAVAREFLKRDGVLFSSIDWLERRNLDSTLEEVFGRENRVEEIIWVQNTTKNQSPTYSTNHEYVEVYARNIDEAKKSERMFKEVKPGFTELSELLETANPDYPSIEAVEKRVAKLFEEHRAEFTKLLESEGIKFDAKLDPWKGVYNYKNVEYRDLNGKLVSEKAAKAKKARLWLWREGDPSMPQVKEDSQKDEFRDPDDETFRFYKPPHPKTKKECPHPKTGWRWSFKRTGRQKTSFEELRLDHRIAWGADENKIPQVKKFIHETEFNVCKSVVHDYTDGEKELTSLFGKSRSFPNPKPSTLISRFVQQTTDSGDVVMDFFTGSGTTGHALIRAFEEDEIHRKFILIEGADYFDSMVIPRMKKVFASKSWKNGCAAKLDGAGVFLKYSTLEQYEDALATASYSEDEGDLFRNTKLDPYSQYVFLRDEKQAHALELDYEKDEVEIDLTKLYPDIDLAETLSCVTGKWIKRITEDEVEFADGSKESLAKPDWKLLKPLIFWGPAE